MEEARWRKWHCALNSWFTSGTEVAIAQSRARGPNTLVNEFYCRVVAQTSSQRLENIAYIVDIHKLTSLSRACYRISEFRIFSLHSLDSKNRVSVEEEEEEEEEGVSDLQALFNWKKF